MKQSNHTTVSASPRSAAASLESVSPMGRSFPAQTKTDAALQRAPKKKDDKHKAQAKMDSAQMKKEQKKGGAAMTKMDPAQTKKEDKKPVSAKMDPAQKKDDGDAVVSSGGTAQMKMTEGVQSKMESVFNTDFSNVNIHVGDKASSVGALAYTQGNDIHFAQGKFSPETKSGAALLGHELTHVVQQRSGRVQANTSIGGLPVNNDPGLEKEADNMGAKAAGLF